MSHYDSCREADARRELEKQASGRPDRPARYEIDDIIALHEAEHTIRYVGSGLRQYICTLSSRNPIRVGVGRASSREQAEKDCLAEWKTGK